MLDRVLQRLYDAARGGSNRGTNDSYQYESPMCRVSEADPQEASEASSAALLLDDVSRLRMAKKETTMKTRCACKGSDGDCPRCGGWGWIEYRSKPQAPDLGWLIVVLSVIAVALLGAGIFIQFVKLINLP